MNRALTLLAAATCAALAISSAGFAAEWTSLPFQLAKTSDAGRVQFSIQHRQDGQRPGNWSQSVALTELQGLGANPFLARSASPIRFALIRPAGRLDCTGSVRSSEANGRCSYAANAAFSAMLAQRGIGRPSLQQSFRLALSDFRPEVLDALATAGYPRPTLDESVALGIFDIAPPYVRGLAAAGYRPGTIAQLVAFKIHKVTPEYVASFARLGYRNLPGDKLVAMKIFGVTPQDVRALQAQGVAAPSTDQLVRRRLAGVVPGTRRRGD